MGIQQTLFCIWWCLHFIGKEQTTCQTTLLCTSQWLNWINLDKPDTGDGDREALTAAQRLAFCPAGKITAVECQTVDGIASFSTGEVAQCTVEGGSVCLTADNEPIPCSDYQIRYYCTCEAHPTNPPVTVSHGTPIATPGVTSRTSTVTVATPYRTNVTSSSTGVLPACIGDWSSWINTDTPDGDGDLESWSAAQKAVFCPMGKVTSIECATVSGIASYSTGEIQQCTLETGSRCMNDDNFPVPCCDYKIRYFCDCKGFDTYTHTSHDSHTNLNTSWQVRHEPTTVSYSGSYEYHNEVRSYSVDDWTFLAPSCITILMLLYVW